MPIRIKRFRKKATIRRRPVRRNPLVRYPLKRISKKVYNFSRWVDVAYRSTVALSSTVVGFSKSFALSDLSTFSDFTNLFEEYRICMVAAYIHLQTNPDAERALNDNTTLTNANFYPKVWYVSDKDDVNTPTLAEIKEKQGVKCKVLRPNAMIKFAFKPSVLNQTFGTTITTGYAPKYNQWIDDGNVNVTHYGMKAVFDCEGVSPQTPFYVRIDYKYYIQCKSPK